MDIRSFFKGNEKINVIDKSENISYKAMVMEVTSKGIYINQPVSRNVKLNMREGEVWDFNMESGDALYFFSSRVLKRAKQGLTPLYLIEPPANLRRQQRRQFYRLNIKIDVEYKIIKEGELKEDEKEGKHDTILVEINEEDEMYRDIKSFDEKNVGQEYAEGVYPGFTIDLSGGGMQMVSENYLRSGADLLIRIMLPGFKDGVVLKGHVIRSFSIHGGTSKKYRTAIVFKEIDEKIRDIIIEFIFDQMRKRRK